MITVLAGGVGAARFLRGLAAVVPPSEVTAIVNVGDDLDRFGLRICPDLDSITYWLADVVHPEQQWGRADESHVVAGELSRFGHESWFTLGDRDLGVHLHRSMRLRDGLGLAAVTAEVTAAFGLELTLLPVTDDLARTVITTSDGRELLFQEYWVRERAAPPVSAVRLDGAADARPAPGVIEAIMDADTIIIAPSNPVVSIDTILAVPDIAPALRTTTAPVIGVSPIIGGQVVRGMADKLLPAIGVEVSARGVARHYGDLLDGFVIDHVDVDQLGDIEAAGIPARVTDTLMDDPDVAAALARTCLAFAAEQTP